LLILTLAKEIPVSQIAALIGEHDTKVWRVIGSYVNKIYKGQDYHTVQKLGVDETSTRKGHNYVTVSADLETGHVLFATQGKGSTTIETFTNELPEHHAASAQIIEISMDMSPSFIFGVANHLPAASITFDKFHVIKQLNEALDEVRRNEQMKNPLLKGSRYSWLKTRKTLRQRNVKHCKL
jgi:transposase